MHHKALEEVLEEGPAVTEDTLCLSLCTHGQSGGCLMWVWGGATHCRLDYRKALLPLEHQKGEMIALRNLPSCSCSQPALLYRPDTFIVKALGKTLACVFPAEGCTPQSAEQPWALL